MFAARTCSDPANPSLNRTIVTLALPALGSLIAEPIFLLIDSALVGHLGAASLAGLSLASTVLTTVVGLFVFLAYATTATTARLFGAGAKASGIRASIDGLYLAGILGLAALLVLWLGAPIIITQLGAQGAVADQAVTYLRACAPGLPGMLLVYAATGALRGLLNTRTPLLVASLGAVINTALNATFIYGMDLGIAGSGAGTAIAQTLMALALIRPLIKAAKAEHIDLKPHLRGIRTSLGAGAALFVRTVSLRLAILATVWAATALGQESLAAHQIVNSLWNFATFALDALAIAAQALIGTALGQASSDAATSPTPARAHLQINAVLSRCLLWGVLTGAVIGVFLALSAPWLVRIFSSDPALGAAARPALLVAASAMPLAGAVYLFDGVLMGSGDGRYLAGAGLFTLVPYLPLVILLGTKTMFTGQYALTALWISFAWVFMGARALSTGLRIRTEAWKH